MFNISVHICTYNPREEHLWRTLEGLKSQTLGLDRWELLLIDNASTEETVKKVDLAWHPNARYILESKLGKTNALIHAIRQAQAPLLLTVDDDNVLNPDYLEQCLKIAAEYPKVGTFGGQIFPEYEVPPLQWAQRHVVNLSVYEADSDVWSNLPRGEFFPPGAGMCFRRDVGLHYAGLVESDPIRAKLDRQGELMVGCGDTDLAFGALDLGLGNGRFTALKLTHLIPKERTSDKALLDLIERTAYSSAILQYIRPESCHNIGTTPVQGWRKKLYSRGERFLKLLLPKEERLARQAALRGLKQASHYIARCKTTQERD